jgi:putative Mg2+ transporter-C (MgtC) family protein
VLALIAAATSFDLDSDVVVRLLFAAGCGAAVGAEREAGDQPAGLRTHIAVALGAALFGVVSTLGFLEFQDLRARTNVNIDVARVASNVVVGIGFLGAGVIFRQANVIRNLTTAASLWAVAAIGLACGTGDITTAMVATVVLLGSLILLRPLRSWIRERFADTSTPIRIRLVDGVTPDAFLARHEPGARLELAERVIEKDGGRLQLMATLRGHPDEVRRWMSEVSLSADVESAGEA